VKYKEGILEADPPTAKRTSYIIEGRQGGGGGGGWG
jgi:hypothetical protein